MLNLRTVLKWEINAFNLHTKTPHQKDFAFLGLFREEEQLSDLSFQRKYSFIEV